MAGGGQDLVGAGAHALGRQEVLRRGKVHEQALAREKGHGLRHGGIVIRGRVEGVQPADP